MDRLNKKEQKENILFFLLFSFGLFIILSLIFTVVFYIKDGNFLNSLKEGVIISLFPNSIMLIIGMFVYFTEYYKTKG